MTSTTSTSSATKWIGEVPSGWRVLEPRRVFSLRREPERPGDIHLTPSQKYGVLPQEEYVAITGSQVVRNLSGTTMQHVEAGDFISHLRTFQGGLELAKQAGKVSPAYTVVTPGPEAFPNYYKYVLKSRGYISQIASVTDQLRDGQSMRFPEFNETWLPVPPFEEQKLIADYLDRETAEIDKLSAEAKSLIGLAAERGTALAEKLIWGLNVPFIRLKFTADILSGHPFKSAHFRELSEDTTPLLRGINVSPHGVNWDSAVAIPSSEAGEFSDYTLQEGDLVLGLDRPIIGSGLRLAKIDKIDAGSLLVQRVARIRSKDPSTSNDWIKAALNSSRFKAHLEPDFTGVSVPHMSPRQLSEFAIPIPPIDVQNEILSQVHAEEIAVRSSIHDLQTLVTMLNERRGALISAAVTGQIDVAVQGVPAAEQLQDETEVHP